MPPDPDDTLDDVHDEEDDPLEAYCVRCKQIVEMEDPQPVWTRKGTPGTRGFCPLCGTIVFRMGRTSAHKGLKRPGGAARGSADPTTSRRPLPQKSVPTTYVNYAPADADLAQRLADDLERVGVRAWLPTEANHEDIAWAGGVHPALDACTQMLVLLSAAALADEAVREAWAFFREKRKPIVVAQLDAVEVPDDLRRAPRVDLSGDYRPALRELVHALAE